VAQPAKGVPEIPRSITHVAAEKAKAETAAASAQQPPATAPAIDWRGEGERMARITVEQAIQADHQRFAKPKSSPVQPAKRPHQFEWNPEPETVGFAGLLPFVRLGKRCIVGLGFFGCALGELPEPNGHLFDDMRNPDRPRSSVPDSGESEAH
jgi:hypothetical protein